MLDSILTLFFMVAPALAQTDALPSWNAGPARDAIVTFVEKVTDEAGPDFVPIAERIAVFDNDGTLWSEQPAYFQAMFIFDRVEVMAPDHPGWKIQQPFKGVLEGDLESALAGGTKALLELAMATHAGMSTEEFARIASDWLETATHPTMEKRYLDMVYQPMLELLDYLRANGFKTFIVSGGGIEFLRVFAEKVYGVPPEQVIGSSIKTEYVVSNGVPLLMRLPEMNFIDDKAGKPVGINSHIGRRPIAAFGNSDGDYEMLEWVTAGDGIRLGLIVHHTDTEREWAYDRKSHVGRLDKALDIAASRNWVLVDMKNDWKAVYPSDRR